MTDVLIVEDDPTLVEVLAEIVSDEGHTVATARNGRQALERLRSGGPLPRVLLMDLMMPVMDGWTLRREMLADPVLAQVPVIVFSAVDLVRRGRDLHASAMIEKPVDLQRLFTLLEEHCGKKTP
jgi:CheY-like chemotaxis protein